MGDSIPHHLVAVGASGWDMAEIYKELEGSPVRERIHFPGYVSDDQLLALYQHASVYVHPSLYEGFGLTVLEAMAAGCPVVTSNVTSLPEVAGDAALLVDPLDEEEIADAVKNICLDNQLASDLIEKGKRRSAQFSWDRCAREVATIYTSVS